jgi:uncharacterized membrane protein
MKLRTFHSDLSGNEYPLTERISGRSLRTGLLELIQKEHSDFNSDSFLSKSELSQYREKYISNYLVRQVGELQELENKVLSALSTQTTLSDKLDGDTPRSLTIGQKLADRVASFGGSWPFIISFGIFLFLWIALNGYWLANRGFDPYPFILLNLILSCLAAVQAPVIMMSQNRQEQKDRERAKNDYMINLKSEMEIRMLHEKMDHLTIHQIQELLEIQRLQIEMMTDILQQVKQDS